MQLTELILQKPNLSQNEEYKVSSIVSQYLDSTLECYTTDKSQDVIKLVCVCIQSILCQYRGYKLVETLSEFLKNSSDEIKKEFSTNLLKILEGLLKETNQAKTLQKKTLAKELDKVLSLLSSDHQEADKKVFAAPSGRSARIANLAKNSPKSPKKVKLASPTTFRLFGKDLDDLSLKVKGSQLNNTPPPKNKKSGNTPNIKPKKVPTPVLEENSADFVAIDTKVEFQPDKLSEHQKEVLKKRREDIPALYEDLSQSVSNSQDLFAKFNSQSCEKKLANKTSEKKETDKSDKAVKTHLSEDLFSSTSISQFENIKDVDSEEATTNQHKENYEIPNKVSSFTKTSPIAEQHPKDSNLDEESNKSDPISNSGKTPNSEKKNSRVEKELQKLKMDVVGADNYISVGRRTRPKHKDNKIIGQKSKWASEKKSSIELAPRRRKSISAIEELTNKTVNDSDLKNPEEYRDDIKKHWETILSASSNTPSKNADKQKVERCSVPEIFSPDSQTPGKSDHKPKTLPTIAIAETPKTTRRRSIKQEHRRKSVEDITKTLDKNEDEKSSKSKKKKKILETESEDIIESSQECCPDITLLNTSKKQKMASLLEEKTLVGVTKNIEVKKDTPINSIQDTTISRDTSLDTTHTQDSLTQDISPTNSEPFPTKKIVVVDERDITSTQDTLTQITQETPSQLNLDMLSEVEKPTVIYLDLPKKPNLTESEQIMCRMDTMSICTDQNEFKGFADKQDLKKVDCNTSQTPTSSSLGDILGEHIKQI